MLKGGEKWTSVVQCIFTILLECNTKHQALAQRARTFSGLTNQINEVT